MHCPRVIIIGIDGATWKLISPWVEKGVLPNFARLMKEGAWGDLQSTIPPVTAPAWSSMITGCNPGKHGLFDFTAHRQDSYQVEYTYGGLRRCPTVWKTLSDRGYRVGVVNVPMTYPPETVTGYMISGLDTPDELSPFISPDGLHEELKSKLGRVRLDIRHLGFMNDDSKRITVLKELIEIEEERLSLVKYLARNHPVDVMMFVVNVVDQVQHHFWHYMDPEHPQYQVSGAEEFGDAILQAYQKVDGILGDLIDEFGDQTLFMLVSDHGFQATSDTIVHINKALAEVGLLKFHDSISLTAGTADFVSSILRKVLSPQLKQRLVGLMPWARAKLETMSTTALIDWSATKAYSFEVMVTAPNIWINSTCKRPYGIVSKEDYRHVVDDVKHCLMSLKHPQTGRAVISRVLEKEELYHGPALDEAPDLIPVWWEGNGFTPKASVAGGKVVERETVEVVPEQLDGGKDWGGTHSAEGIILLRGPQVSPGQLLDAKITDIAPTLFAALQEPAENDFDGRDLLETEVENLKDRQSAGPLDNNDAFDSVAVSDEDREKIKQRLRLLGYLD